jgi:Na+-driven multidrug efflux pump
MPVFLGVLHLGLPGVALSDGCSDAILFGLTGYALLKYRSQLGLGTSRRGDWQVEIKTWGQIASIGVPYQAARAMDMIAQVVLVRVMMETGDKAVVGGYGVAMLLINIAASAASCLGIAGGIVIGQNAGAGKPERASACLRLVVLSLAVIGLAIVALASFPDPVVRVFTDNDKIVAQASATIGLLRWAMPAALLNNALLRAYTAVSPNRIGNALSIVCASLTMALAELGTGSALDRVAIAMIAGQYLRLILLAVMYRRAFRLPLERSRSQVL